MSSVILSAEYADSLSGKPNHFHDCHQILFVTKGSAEIRVDEQRYSIKAGNLVLFSRFEQHSVMAGSADYCRYILQIGSRIPAGGKGYKLFSILFNRPVGFCNVLDVSGSVPEFLWIFEQILRERNQPRQLREDMLDLLIQQLLITVCRHMPGALETVGEDCFETVGRIQSRFERDFREHFTLNALAEEYGLSASYLSHLFKRITGNSVMGYLQSCRIAAAKKYLAQTTMSIGEVVESCGFSDSSNFSRTFRALNGCTPSQFRERNQQ